MKTKQFFCVFAVIFIIMSAFSGCSDFHSNDSTLSGADFPVTVSGTNIMAPPKKIAVLSDAHASAISALGCKNLIAGAPSEYVGDGTKDIVDLGSVSNPNTNAVYELLPDLLIVPTKLSESFAKGLTQRGIAYVVIEVPAKYADVSAFYEDIAKVLFGNIKYKENYEKHIKGVQNAINSLKQTNKTIEKKVIVFTDDMSYVVSGDMLAGEVFKMVGINNVADTCVSEMMSVLDIAKANPDVIFCPKGTSKRYLEMEGLKDINAVKNGAVYEIDAEALFFAGEGFTAVLQDMSAYLKG